MNDCSIKGAACVAVSAFLFCATTGTSAADVGSPSATESNDIEFLRAAALWHLEEIKLGELARRRASALDLRTLGRTTAEAHFRGLSRLMPLLAQRAHAHALETLRAEKFPSTQVLDGLGGRAFDGEYWRMSLAHTKRMISLHSAHLASQDREVKSYTLWTLEMLKGLFKSARDRANPFPIIPRATSLDARSQP